MIFLFEIRSTALFVCKVTCNNFDYASRIYCGRYVTPFVTNILIFKFTENTEFGVSMIYNVYTPALEEKNRYTYTYDIRWVSAIYNYVVDPLRKLSVWFIFVMKCKMTCTIFLVISKARLSFIYK